VLLGASVWTALGWRTGKWAERTLRGAEAAAPTPVMLVEWIVATQQLK
jgi:hypothetical protein